MDIKDLQTQSDWNNNSSNNGQSAQKEETIEDLIAKLEQKGKKVVIHDESDNNFTPQFNNSASS